MLHNVHFFFCRIENPEFKSDLDIRVRFWVIFPMSEISLPNQTSEFKSDSNTHFRILLTLVCALPCVICLCRCGILWPSSSVVRRFQYCLINGVIWILLVGLVGLIWSHIWIWILLVCAVLGLICLLDRKFQSMQMKVRNMHTFSHDSCVSWLTT